MSAHVHGDVSLEERRRRRRRSTVYS